MLKDEGLVNLTYLSWHADIYSSAFCLATKTMKGGSQTLAV